MFIHNGEKPALPDERQLDFIAKKGFNYIRIPLDYRFWTKDFAYFHPDEKVFNNIDGYIKTCQQRGLHVSINLHRAPGYCINLNSIEKHNLWKDKEAQDAFVFIWENFAKRYKGISPDVLSFDLLNEPPDIGQYGFTRKRHEKIIRGTRYEKIDDFNVDRKLLDLLLENMV